MVRYIYYSKQTIILLPSSLFIYITYQVNIVD
jgi:hypothetical protein